MTAFTKKTIKPTKRVCLRLKEARESAGVSLKEVSKKTKIDTRYLIALEECRFDDLPKATIYKKNFIKKYLKAVDVNPAPFIKQFLNEEHVAEDAPHPDPIIKKTHFRSLPMYLKYSFIIAIILVFLAYLGLQVRNILEPPKLIIHAPADGMVTIEPLAIVKGETDSETQITINGREITCGSKGNFEENLDLAQGVNQISISATTKHGKTTTEVLHIIVKETKKTSVSNNQEPLS